MTEKRFKLVKPNNKFKHMQIGIIEDDVRILTLAEVVDLLNGLYDIADRLNTYADENEQLKQEVENIKDVNVRCCNDYSHYRRENEQLKSDLEYYRETYSIQEYGLDTETHVQLSSPTLSRKELLKENEQLKHDATVLIQSNKDYRKENEQLKQRNDRQYNQLKQLWELIEKEDYNTLRSMLNQRETDEKLLQSEWRTYCD